MQRAASLPTVNIMWFKRDLRVHDNRALTSAAEGFPVLPLYIIEPELWQQPDMSVRQWDFICECLVQLRNDLARLGQSLVIRRGEVTDVLTRLQDEVRINALWSHEETGNDWTFRRDRRVAAWCRAAALPWREVQNHGVQRRLASRDGWAKGWDAFMAQPTATVAALPSVEIDMGAAPDARDVKSDATPCPDRQKGGRAAGIERLTSFLERRGQTYQKAMSSPLDGATACSRLSPHLAWGTLSMREVAQATWDWQRKLKADPPPKGRTAWNRSLRSFTGRLHWHCHFIQKLEDDPRIEFQNFHSRYDGLRPSAPDQDKVKAWAQGETGLPFVDACMRSLRATGWLNFRMRAMVMSTASFHLWLDWRAPGQELARLFTDYEAGIHWSQVQMQSGTTGINTVRIYNPVKQGHDQDPTGAFTRRWLPELATIPDEHLQEPWKAENAAQVLGRLYPEPIIDHLSAARAARERIWAVRREAGYHAEASAIQTKHGSRKSGIPNRGQRKKPKASSQLSLPLGD